MGRKLKKFLFLLLSFLFLLPFPVEAFVEIGIGAVGGLVVDFFLRIASGLIAFGLLALSYLALGGYAIAVVITSWFITIALNVPIVNSWARDVGWTLTRNFVNMLFIIILAWIGIATILRLREYRTGRIFLNLIVIALLVNFSPVLVGVVVDISNIIINFFLQEMTALQPTDQNPLLQFLSRVIGPAGERMAHAAALAWTGNFQERIQSVMFIGGMGVYFFVGAFVFFLVSLLFLLRTIAFWILLIVSPFAFICYILPATKKYWKMWWQQLFHWALIGVLVSFFLYLSFVFLDATMPGGNINQDTPGYIGNQWGGPELETFLAETEYESAGGPQSVFTQGGIDLITSILPVISALAFLLIGIGLSFTGAAAGGKIIEKHVPKFIRERVRRELRRARERIGIEARRRMPERVERTFARMAVAETPGARIPGRRGRAIRAVTRPILGPTWALARAIGRAGTGLKEADLRWIKERERALEKLEDERKIFEQIRSGPPLNRIAALRVGIEKGMLRDLKRLGLQDREIIELFREAVRIRPELGEKILKANTHLAEEMARIIPLEARERLDLVWKSRAEQAKYKNLVTKITAKLSTKEIPKIDLESVWADARAKVGIMKFWKGVKVGAAAREFEDEFVDPYVQMVERIHQFRQRRKRGGFQTYNPEAWDYFDTTAGREFGFRQP